MCHHEQVSEGVSQLVSPETIRSQRDLLQQLEALRRRAARGTQKTRMSLDDVAKGSQVPRSTVHAYLTGRLLPNSDALDQILRALGATDEERPAWAAALDRLQQQRFDATMGAQHASIPRQLPAPPRHFVGRTALLDSLEEMWQRSLGRSPLIAIVGAGGVGKTSVVLEWAAGHLSDFPDGQIFIDLRGFSRDQPVEPARAQRRILTAFGVDPATLTNDPEALTDRYRSALGNGRLLLVLDNVVDASQARPLLAGAPSATTIITSRRDVRGLQVVEGATVLSVDPMPGDEALRVLSDAVGHQPDDADELLRLCGGFPLALRLVGERAARGDHPGAGERPLDALSMRDGSTGLDFRGVIAASVDALRPSAEVLFTRLGVIPGSWISIEAVAALSGDPGASTLARATRDDLVELCSLHLLSQDTGGWWRHDLITDFATERIRENTATFDEASGALVEHYARLAASLSEQPNNHLTRLDLPDPYPERTSDEVEAFFSREEEIALNVADLALETGRLREASLIGGHLAMAGLGRGPDSGVRNLLLRLVEASQVSGEDHLLALAWQNIGRLLVHAGDSKGAVEAFRKALDANRHTDQTSLRIRLLASLGAVLDDVGLLTEAEPIYQEGIELANRSGDLFELSLIETNYGAGVSSQRDRREGAKITLQAADHAVAAGHLERALLPLLNAMLDALDDGDIAGAQEYLARAEGCLTVETPIDQRALLRLRQGQLAGAQGRYEDAYELFREVADTAAKVVDTWSLVVAHHHWGEFAMKAGKLGLSREHLLLADHLATQHGYSSQAVNTALMLVQLSMLEDDRAEAENWLAYAENEARATDNAIALAEAADMRRATGLSAQSDPPAAR